MSGLSPPPAGEPSVPGEPLVASGTPREWLAWLRVLLTAARERLAGAAALLVGALAVCAGALWVFGEVADEVAEGETAALDTRALTWLRQFSSPSLDEVATLITAFGSELVWLLLPLLLIAFGVKRRWGTVTSLLVVAGGAAVLNSVLKDYFQRARPSAVVSVFYGQEWSFPSGHATVGAAFYLFLAYVGAELLAGVSRVVWVGLMVLLIFLIGLTRLYLGVHYLTDVIAGIAAGAAWVAAVIGAGHIVALRRRPPASASPKGA